SVFLDAPEPVPDCYLCPRTDLLPMYQVRTRPPSPRVAGRRATPRHSFQVAPRPACGERVAEGRVRGEARTHHHRRMASSTTQDDTLNNSIPFRCASASMSRNFARGISRAPIAFMCGVITWQSSHVAP